MSRQTVLQRVKRGELDAVHVHHGKRKGLRIKVIDDQATLFGHSSLVRGQYDDGSNDRIDDVNTRIDGVNNDVNTRIDDLRTELRSFRAEVNDRMERFDTRLRNVEIAFGKVDQRLLIIERFVLPTPEQPAE